MIVIIKHKGLKEFWTKGLSGKLPSDQKNKIRLILDTLNDANEIPQDLFPFKSWNTHKLRGSHVGFWSITVKENWRIIFKIDGKNIIDVDYLDYH